MRQWEIQTRKGFFFCKVGHTSYDVLWFVAWMGFTVLQF
jgi:hypothetical protein